MKNVQLEPISSRVAIATHDNLLQALLVEELNVPMSCGGRGICATCHCYVEAGSDALAPRTERERKTLAVLASARPTSRLACQARVVGEGVVVRLPEGMYVERTEDLEALLGRRAEHPLLHPVDGSTLVEAGKIITRSRIRELETLNVDVAAIRDAS